MKKLIKLLCPFLLCGAILIPHTNAHLTATVIRDGTVIQSDVANFIRDGRTYVSVKAFFEGSDKILWDETTATATIINGTDLLQFSEHAYTFTCNDETVYTDTPICIVNGRMFVPVRALGETLGYEVSWDAAGRTATLTEQAPDTELPENVGDTDDTVDTEGSTDTDIPADTENTVDPAPAYNETDLYWLSRIICAESCVEPYEGKLAVGNVVLNRVKNADYPDTIYDVIFDRRYAVQFEPTINGSIYNTPDEECIRAAKECLDGKRVVGDCIYFLNPDLASNKWIINNCTYVTTIGGHDFYI